MMMGGWGYGPYGGYAGGYWWMGLIGMLVQVLFWIGIVVLAVRFFGHYSKKHHVGTLHDNALDILRERYARGDIDLEEFQRRRQELQK